MAETRDDAGDSQLAKDDADHVAAYVRAEPLQVSYPEVADLAFNGLVGLELLSFILREEVELFKICFAFGPNPLDALLLLFSTRSLLCARTHWTRSRKFTNC